MTSLLLALALLGAQAPASNPRTTTRSTAHLQVTLSTSAAHVAPGGRITLRADVTPRPTMHVYAPGQADYVTVSLKLARDEAFTSAAPQFPPPEKMHLDALNEDVVVYVKPFRISTDLTLASTPELREKAAAGEALTVKGTLRYQACDDHVCYLPTSVPIEWTVALGPK